MVRNHRSRRPGALSRLLADVRRALEEGPQPGQRHSTPRHEAYAIGLGLAPRSDRRG